MMAPLTAFGARLAREKLGIPLITVHLQPMAFLSAYKTPLLDTCLRWLRVMPVEIRKILLSLPNPVDLFALPGIRRMCRESGVTPPRSICRERWHSPDGVLTLFPDCFGAPQPDWPTNLFQWDFPMEDLTAEVAMQPELVDFLAAGEKPVVFTPGSTNVHAENFFTSAAEAVKRLGIRAVFVTRMEYRIPTAWKDVSYRSTSFRSASCPSMPPPSSITAGLRTKISPTRSWMNSASHIRSPRCFTHRTG